MKNQIDLFTILKNEELLKTLYVYSTYERVDDPYEQTRTRVYLNPLTIKGLIRQISPEALHWKYYGQIPSGSIEIIAEKKYKTLFKTAQKIKYNDEHFSCWKSEAKGFAIIEKSDYLVVILAKKEI